MIFIVHYLFWPIQTNKYINKLKRHRFRNRMKIFFPVSKIFINQYKNILNMCLNKELKEKYIKNDKLLV